MIKLKNDGNRISDCFKLKGGRALLIFQQRPVILWFEQFMGIIVLILNKTVFVFLIL